MLATLLGGEQVHGVAVHHLQRTATAASHAGQRLLGDDHRQAGFLCQQLVQVAQQRATAGQHQAALGDIRGQLRRRLLEGALDRLDDGRIAQPPLARGKSMFASADEFIATMLPMAQKAAERIGVDARYLVAQAALETGWGKSIIRQQDGGSSHNLFGIKTGSRWDGASARALTTEYEGGKAVKEIAAFRSYSSFEQSFHDYVSFLQGNDRYQNALDSAANPERFMQELQRAGYATDPQYARKVAQIARQMQTYQAVAAAGTPPLG